MKAESATDTIPRGLVMNVFLFYPWWVCGAWLSGIMDAWLLYHLAIWRTIWVRAYPALALALGITYGAYVCRYLCNFCSQELGASLAVLK
jgi:hypothetical protein